MTVSICCVPVQLFFVIMVVCYCVYVCLLPQANNNSTNGHGWQWAASKKAKEVCVFVNSCKCTHPMYVWHCAVVCNYCDTFRKKVDLEKNSARSN